MTLTLIGINHTDPKGPERLVKGLIQLQPDWITLEHIAGRTGVVPKESIERIVHTLATQPELSPQYITEIVSEVLKKGYEEKVAEGYAALLEKPFAAIDTEDFDEASTARLLHTPDIPYLIETNIRARNVAEFGMLLNRTDLSEFEKKALMGARRALDPEFPLDNSYKRIPVESKERDLIRDAHMEKQIRTMIEQHGPNGIHIGGFAHAFGCYGEFPNLYQRLTDLDPVRVKLCEFD